MPDGVHHLLPERRVSIRRGKGHPEREVGVIEIDRRMNERAVLIDVDHCNVFPGRPGCEILPGIRTLISLRSAVSKFAATSGSTANTLRLRNTGLGDDHTLRACLSSIAS